MRKKCTKCNTIKELSEYRSHRHTWDKLRPDCKACQREYTINWRKLNSIKHLGHKIHKFWPELTLEEAANRYNNLFNEQKGCCAICATHQSDLPRALAVDHDHKSGVVRGLLCYSCNSGIGFLKDSISILDAAKEYLRPELKLVKDNINATVS